MAFPLNDQVYTKSFTPREYEVELLYTAKEKNIIVCLGKNSEQTFLSIKLIQEFATNNRRLISDGGKRAVYILNDQNKCTIIGTYIKQLTDLKVLACNSGALEEFDESFQSSHILVGTLKVYAQLISEKKLSPCHINLVIVDECHKSIQDSNLKFVLQTFLSCNNVPRIIGLAVPVFNLTQEPGRLGLEIEKVETAFQCQVETANDILSIIRYSPKPREYVVEYDRGEKKDLYNTLKSCVLHAIEFLRDHRYDPMEIYTEEFYEDIQKIPDPIQKPFEMMQDFLYILETLGPWCADRAALTLLFLTEKLKIKTPYERHYLLLNMMTSVFIKIRALCDNEFQHLSEKERIYQYSTPKVHRLLQILKIYTPFYIRETNTPEKKANADINSKNCVTKSDKNISFSRNQEKPVKRFGGNWKSNDDNYKKYKSQRYPCSGTDPDHLCGVIFVDKGFTAKVLFYLLSEICKHDEDLHFLSPLYTIERNPDDVGYSRDLEMEHRKQEEVLKRFRIHECNLLIATSILEEGIDIPKCNFVMRYDFPKNYQSYIQCKSRARAMDALHVLLVPQEASKELIWQLAQYQYIEKTLLLKCSNKELTEDEETEADMYAAMIPHYKPLNGDDAPKVTFNSAISLVNRYCAKLPSDTFTRLTPEWRIERVNVHDTVMYICLLRLPINSPLKYVITSYPMPNRAMARRMAALQMCIDLHRENEIDDNLLPIGKENFKAKPEDAEVPALPDESRADFSEARPGTTKRRQYYYKKTAEALTDCRPVVGVPSYLYHINMVLSCPLPEEQNTRGRRIYPPEESAIGFGILTLKKIPKLCPFPIYTRSGEVHVQLKLSKETVILDEVQIERVDTFLNYTFTNVLRLQKYLMLFDPNASENSYIIVPVKILASEGSDVSVDWNFLECIYQNRNAVPTKIPEEDRKNFKFDPSKYYDAVIMPWYRSQDQPQYFYVAEICTNLNPKSSFPGHDYSTFEEYYLKKYGIQIQNLEQSLLDVDHTSARLNFLTPRYVNRKGVALPTSSEETKRAKRENLEQKQILVAELCAIHPFPASLWRQAVCLPCILYRINALLLANQIRCQVAHMINLGQENLNSDFEWPALDFGWSLAEVLKKSKETEKTKQTKSDNIQDSSLNDVDSNKCQNVTSGQDTNNKQYISSNEIESCKQVKLEPTDNARTDEVEKDETIADEEQKDDELEIGTWSNDMAWSNDVTMNSSMDYNTSDNLKSFPLNVTACVLPQDFVWNDIRYGSPTYESDFDGYESDDVYSDGFADTSDESEAESRGLKISYMGENIAEAVEDEKQICKQEINKKILDLLETEKNFDNNFWMYAEKDQELSLAKHKEAHYEFAKRKEHEIMTDGTFISCNSDIAIKRKNSLSCQTECKKPNYKHKDYIETVVKRFTCEVLNKKLPNESARMIKKEINKPNEGNYLNNHLFSFDYQPELKGHPGPSPSLILQALTMSNANDGINLERLETIGDSFLKYAITTYLYCTYDNIHEGKLSHLRSKQVSNLNLYRLGRQKMLGESMIATKFEPHDNWLPPCYYVPKELEQALIESGVPSALWNQADIPTLQAVNPTEITQLVKETEEKLVIMKSELDKNESRLSNNLDNLRCFIPYNLITQHSIPDKSIADCVEALIGAYLIACGPRGALLFMTWLGIHVLPTEQVCVISENEPEERIPGSTPYIKKVDQRGKTTWTQICYGKLEEPQNPLLRYIHDPESELYMMLDGYEELEKSIGYKFRDSSYLLQAFTHASYQPNRLTDCYQRLEFLGDAVLDYLITRHLYEDSRQHSPGALTDLRSALVNNTIFASLAVRCGFHKYFRHLSPGLSVVINRFVRIQEENGHSISEEYYLIGEEECEEAEDVEVPKALGDVFESLAGAIYLDSGMSLDAVWSVYYTIMKSEIEQFSTNVPKSPIRELLELEPETAKFGRPEKLADGRRVRVTVDVFGKGSFKGIGRNYRIAKCTAAKCALKKLKSKAQNYPRQKL
ncbi:endoribonuclease Dcr-1 [Monomorium pharaonis]|uniref:endoribonuclease Dcr-1 n=1 Tax=Monomorium pharaonis TaxID=307658 RepID=UPI00063ED7C2|nr:endoribonuclease Dcr-1 [Monomorium pharaonis]XP_012529232.1 endoribonuclease Dcr-1 [Monomorium pharaonis]XP_036145450.1 endoribonuclease Dcr-1 [Monomorium pharaonis]